MPDKPEWTWRHATELRNHWWWRPGWQIGTRYYAFHLAVGDSPGVTKLVAQYQNALKNIDGLDLIPREWLHITMQGLGFVDDISTEDLESMLKTTSEALSKFEPFTLTFNQPVIRPEAVVLAPEPVEPLDRLRNSVRTAIEKALGPGAVDLGPTGYQPHLSFAYVSADQAAAAVLCRRPRETTRRRPRSCPLADMRTAR
ncbi:2'-5' RNA ligase family protein [Pseudonocardia sp.]|uniref:2'-5' RNA ligase family protein n=1 Tax=Pseudonocardia sp. TaxID=60912 RepID=UPI0031FCF7C1